MSWATPYIAKLQAGETVQFRPRGASMMPKIKSGQLCIVEPLGNQVPQEGDIVLCKVNGKQYLHLIKAVQQERFLIGGVRSTNGWISLGGIYGKLVRVEP